MKKRVREDESGDEEIVAGEPKRARLEPAEDEDEGDEDMQGSSSDENGRGGDSESDEDMHDELDNDEAFDLHRKKGFSFSGVLESVRLDRFMSHECFEYKLGPNVNIINGPNGSGKSAIVAAVQIGLGARSSTTERATCLDDHIMFGKDSAIITIRIRNRIDPAELQAVRDEAVDSDDEDGDNVEGFKDASTYRHDFYGDAIVIERTLKRGSSGSWTLKTAKGKRSVNSQLGDVTPRREVMNICDHFGFMVDNPVAVLTQTSTKKFLAQCRPSDHMDLFQKATLLGPLTEELVKTELISDQIKLLLNQKRANLPAVTKQLEELAAAYEESKEMKTLGRRIREMQVREVWTIVYQEEDLLAKMEEQTRDCFELELSQIQQKEKKLLKSVEEVQEMMNSNEEDVEKATEAAKDAGTALKKASVQHEARKKELLRRDALIQSLARELEDKEAEVEGAEKRLDRARSFHVKGQASKAHIASDLEKVTGDISAVEEQSQVAEEELFAAAAKRKEFAAETEAAKERLSDVKQAFEAKRREAAMQRQSLGKANYVGRFGQDMEKIVNAIDGCVRDGVFNSPPVGPLGQHVSLLDDSWAPSIQQAIGNHTLRTMLVGDRHDLDILQRIFGKVRARCPVTVVSGGLGRTPRHNVSSGKAQVQQFGYATVLDLIEVNNDDAFNALVDGSQIEGNVLVEGEQAMSDFSARAFPNVVKCWDRSGSQGFSRGGSHVVRPSENRTGQGSVLAANREGHVLGLEDAAKQLQFELQQLQQQQQDYRRETDKLQDAERRANRALAQLRREHDAFLKRKAELEARMEEAASEFDASPFEDDIRDCKSQVDEVALQKRNAESGRPDLVESIESASGARKKAKDVHTECSKVANEYASRMETLAKNMSRDKAALRRVHPQKVSAETKVRKAHAEIAAKRADLAGCIEKARTMEPTRPHDIGDKSADKLSSEILAMQERLEAEEARRDGKSAAVIEKEFYTAQKKFEENNAVMTRIEGYQKALERGVARRKKEKKSIDRIIKLQVNNNFGRFLETRGHKGTVKFRRSDGNSKGELVISTRMANHKTGDGGLHKTKDLRSLSGGERSYTTLSFMLALAEVVANPVRIMDEPDVFMDEASRSAAFTELIKFCTNHLSEKQIILVTPLTMPQGVNPTDAVRIVKLKSINRTGQESQGATQARMDDFLQ